MCLWRGNYPFILNTVLIWLGSVQAYNTGSSGGYVEKLYKSINKNVFNSFLQV